MVTLARRIDLAGISEADVHQTLRATAREARDGDTSGLFMLLRKNPNAASHIAISMPELGDIVGTHGIRLSDAAREADQRSVSGLIDYIRGSVMHVNYPARWEAIIFHEGPAWLMAMQLRAHRLWQTDPEGMLNTMDIAANAWRGGMRLNPSVAEQMGTRAKQLRMQIKRDVPAWVFI